MFYATTGKLSGVQDITQNVDQEPTKGLVGRRKTKEIFRYGKLVIIAPVINRRRQRAIRLVRPARRWCSGTRLLCALAVANTRGAAKRVTRGSARVEVREIVPANQ